MLRFVPRQAVHLRQRPRLSRDWTCRQKTCCRLWITKWLYGRSYCAVGSSHTVWSSSRKLGWDAGQAVSEAAAKIASDETPELELSLGMLDATIRLP